MGGGKLLMGEPTLITDGVTIFVEGTFHTRGTSTVQLSAPTFGDYPGVLVFADEPGAKHTMNGTGSSFYNGAFYAPLGEITVSGNHGEQGQCPQIVANRIHFTGDSNVQIDCTKSEWAKLVFEGSRKVRLVR